MDKWIAFTVIVLLLIAILAVFADTGDTAPSRYLDPSRNYHPPEPPKLTQAERHRLWVKAQTKKYVARWGYSVGHWFPEMHRAMSMWSRDGSQVWNIDDAFYVMRTESGGSQYATNGQYQGLFQLGSGFRATYTRYGLRCYVGRSNIWFACKAWRDGFKHDGWGWGPWPWFRGR